MGRNPEFRMISIKTTLCSLVLLVALLLSARAAMGQARHVAITIDDLPRGIDGGPYDLPALRAMTEKLLRPFRDQHIPVTGFVNAGRNSDGPKELREILDLWLDAGADLGNHSYSHIDINKVSLDTYEADILQGESPILEALTAHGKKLEFYRHPYLHRGPTLETKEGLQSFLDQHGYRVAPVTLDNSDYEYAALYTKPEFRERVRREYVPYVESVTEFFEQRSVEVTGHEISQILIVHANQMNADLMPELLSMFRHRGYTFVTLSKALEDPAYQLPDTYVGRSGFSWIHRWSISKGMAAKGEPDPPEWVEQGFKAR